MLSGRGSRRRTSGKGKRNMKEKQIKLPVQIIRFPSSAIPLALSVSVAGRVLPIPATP